MRLSKTFLFLFLFLLTTISAGQQYNAPDASLEVQPGLSPYVGPPFECNWQNAYVFGVMTVRSLPQPNGGKHFIVFWAADHAFPGALITCQGSVDLQYWNTWGVLAEGYTDILTGARTYLTIVVPGVVVNLTVQAIVESPYSACVYNLTAASHITHN